MGRWMPGIDLPLNDITRIDVANKEACASQCSQRGDCKAMSFNTQGRDCWLKNRAANNNSHPARTSWVKDGVNVEPAPPAKNQQPAPKPAQPTPQKAPQVAPTPKSQPTKLSNPNPVAKAHKFTGKKIAFTIDGVDFYLRICTMNPKYSSFEMKAANAAAMKDLTQQGFGPEFKFNMTADGFLYTDAMKTHKENSNSDPTHIYLGIAQDRGYTGKAIAFTIDTSGKVVSTSGYNVEVCKFEYKNKRIVPLADDKYCHAYYLDKGCIAIASIGYDGQRVILDIGRFKGPNVLKSEPLEVEVVMEEIDNSCDNGCNRSESTHSIGSRTLSNDKEYNYYYSDFQKVALK
jgi:hypothetical protein